MKPHDMHPELCRDVLAQYPDFNRSELHRQLDMLLDWEPIYACYGTYRYSLIKLIPISHQRMLQDIQASRKETVQR